MNTPRAPRYRVTIYELRDGKTTQKLDTYGTGFITAVATLDGDLMDVHFGSGGPRHLQEHIAAAIADEHPHVALGRLVERGADRYRGA